MGEKSNKFQDLRIPKSSCFDIEIGGKVFTVVNQTSIMIDFVVRGNTPVIELKEVKEKI